jgi:hypothetical protein
VENVDACRWSEIGRNYAPATHGALDAQMRTSDLGGGKIMLWLGPPGTGKTHALRALGWEMRTRLKLHYILDPEIFLANVGYLMAVFRDREDDSQGEAANDDAKPSRLIVLEDAGELVGADARSRVGQGLSRLLNLTDGLPGQGTRTRVLITTNEDIGRLHSAVTRAGRCGQLVRFTPLEPPQAKGWMTENGRPDYEPESQAVTLADLYASLRGEIKRETVRVAGFSRPQRVSHV